MSFRGPAMIPTISLIKPSVTETNSQRHTLPRPLIPRSHLPSASPQYKQPPYAGPLYSMPLSAIGSTGASAGASAPPARRLYSVANDSTAAPQVTVVHPLATVLTP
jgi:hypothetical protein